MYIFESSSVLKTKEFSQQISKALERHQKNSSRATVVRLEGDLGSGKTTLTRFLVRNFSPNARVLSPTFVLMRKIKLPPRATFREVVHIDAYRLEEKAASALNLKKELQKPSALILIEWPKNLGKTFSSKSFFIRFSHGSKENERIFKTNIPLP